ncbi:MAG: FtsX-like permease family protein [Cellulomonas sp.]|jgi:putative ABC transport system permease protein|nr:FtsX-like permease family protein [Cellulomonas sp.]
MLRVAWRDVRFHPVRFLMSLLAVALGVAFVSGTFALRAMLASTFDGIVQTTVSGDAYVVADNGSSYAPDWMTYLDERGLVSDTLVPPIEALDEVAWASADYTGAVLLTGADGTLVASGGGAPSQSWIVDDTLGDQGFDLTGTAPVGEGQIALEAETARRAGLGIGDTTTVVVGAGLPHEVTVTGIVTATEGTPFAGAVVVGIDRATAKAAFAPTGTVTTIVVHAADGVSQDDLAQAVGTVLPADSGATVKTGDAVRADARAAISSELGFVSTFLMVFAGIALFVGAFIIANTFAMVVRQRLRETAVLRAVGASRRQVFASFVVQAGIVGLIGSALGIGAGFGLVAAIRAVFESMGMALSGAIPVTVPGVAIPVVVGVVVSMVAAALPARRAARTAPVEAMRPDGQDTQRRLVVRGSIGALLTLGGVGLLVAAHQAGSGYLLGGGAAALLVGLVTVSPVLAPPVTRVLAVPFAAAKPFGRLAQRNLARNKRRTANTAAALMIGLALVGATTVIASSATASVDDLIGEQLKADFVLDGSSSAYGIPAAALTELEQVRGATVWAAGEMPGAVGDDAMFLGVGSPRLLIDVMSLNIVEGSAETWTDGVALGAPAADRLGLSVGDTLPLTIAKDTPFEVSADLPVQLVTTTETVSIDVMITDQTLEALLPAEVREQLLTTWQAFAVLDPGADPEAVRAQLVDAVAPYQTISVMDADEFASYLSGQVTQVLNILYALIALSLVIAVLGVVNTLALSVLERTQEIGMMRAVGLSRAQLRWTMVIEGVLVASLGAVLGISAGVGIATVIPSVAASTGLGVLSVSWLAVAALFAGAVVVGVLAAVWPAIRAARIPVLQALVYE